MTKAVTCLIMATYACLASSACDSNEINESPNSLFTISVIHSPQIDENTITEAGPIAELIVPVDMAIDINKLPHMEINIATNGYSMRRGTNEEWPSEIQNSLYLFIESNTFPPDIINIFSTTDFSGKKSNPDSSTINVYAFVIERPGVEYPNQMVSVDFEVDNINYTLDVNLQQDRVPLRNQVLTNGSSLATLPEEPGILVRKRAESYEESIFPILILLGAESHASENFIRLVNEGIAGSVNDTLITGQNFTYGDNPRLNYKILNSTEIGGLLLRK